MPLAAHRDLESLAIGELHELRDVLRIAGPEHGDWLLVHDMSSSADDCRTASSKYNSPLRYFTL